MPDDSKDVLSAFDLLRAEIEAYITRLRGEGAAAFQAGDMDCVRLLAGEADTLTSLLNRANDLRQGWVAATAPPSRATTRTLFAPTEKPSANGEADPDAKKPSRRKKRHHRLRNGSLTPKSAYFLPILQSLAHAGGSAPSSDVIRRVGQVMQGTLQDVDYQPIPSNPDCPRWQKVTTWARMDLVKQGLLGGASPRGIWELTDAGRSALAAGAVSATASNG